jgi:AcrR family transcriptional regulator
MAAARHQFSDLGYDRATMRSIAAEAGVDQKLVAYFFGSKQALFVAATTLPIDGGASVAAVLGGDEAGRGARLARLIMGLLEDPDAGTRLVGLFRAAASEREAARMVRELLGERVWSPAMAALPVEDPALAVSLIATHLLGLVMARCVIGVEPLASLPAEEVVSLLAPILQRHLTGAADRAVTARRAGPGPGPPVKDEDRSGPEGRQRGGVR